MATYSRARPASHWLDYPDTTYGVVAAADFNKWDTAAFDLKTQAISLSDYAVGDGVTDNTAAITSAIADVSASGGTLLVPPKTYLYTSVINIPAHTRIVGFGRASVLKGPGFSRLFSANSSNDADILVADLLLDGTSYTASGTGLDFLSCSMVTLDRVKFTGYRDQVVFDQGQRLLMISTEHVASSATRSGLFIPKGPEAHASVDASQFTSNIVRVDSSHFNFNASATGIPIVDDGGLQHVFDNVQCSYGLHSVYLAGASGVVFRSCDFEFATGDTITTGTTTFVGGASVGTTSALTIGPGNYFGTQVDLTGVDGLLDLMNDFHIASLAVYKNTPSTLHGASIGSGNVAAGGTMFDADPSTNFMQIDRTGIAKIPKTVLATEYRANSNSTSNPQLWVSTLPGSSASYGSNYGFGVDNNGVAIGWGVAFAIRSYTTAGRPSASTAGVGASYYDTTLHKPAWSDGTNWRDAAGTVV